MKSLSDKLGVILAVAGFAIFSYAEVRAEDWRLLGIDDTLIASYDAERIIRISKGNVTVYLRVEYKEKGITEKVESQGRQWENVGHRLDLLEINCVNKSYHSLSTTYYSKEGKILYSDNYSTEWKFIIPESHGEFLYKQVCK